MGRRYCIDIDSREEWRLFSDHQDIQDAMHKHSKDLYHQKSMPHNQVTELSQQIASCEAKLNVMSQEEESLLKQIYTFNNTQTLSMASTEVKQSECSDFRYKMVREQFELYNGFLYPLALKNGELQQDSWKCFKYNQESKSFEAYQIILVSTNELCSFYTKIIPTLSGDCIMELYRS